MDIETLIICTNDDVEVGVTTEDLEDPKNLDYNGGVVYPPNPKFLQSYRYWHLHQSIMWSSHEIHPECDRDRFFTLDSRMRDICLSMISYLMWGDSVVVDILEQDITERITAREVKVFLADQTARENIHQEVYSKMLDVTSSEEAARYRSKEFRDKHMWRFVELSEKYRSHIDMAVFFYFVMVCECIMFAPMFQTICYAAYIGAVRVLGTANLQVMRDEAIHYKHARHILSTLRRKIKKSLAREILDAFVALIDELLVETVGDYKSADGLYSLNICRDHLRHVYTGFMSENSLFYNDDEATLEISRWGKSPAACYMTLPNNEIKNNLMESNSSIYAVDSAADDVDDNIYDNTIVW